MESVQELIYKIRKASYDKDKEKLSNLLDRCRDINEAYISDRSSRPITLLQESYVDKNNVLFTLLLKRNVNMCLDKKLTESGFYEDLSWGKNYIHQIMTLQYDKIINEKKNFRIAIQNRRTSK